MQLEIRF